MIRMGGLEISGIQLVAGLCRDLLGFDRDRSITVEISAVGVIGHGVLGLIDIRCPIVVGVVAPGGIQGGVGVDSVGAEHGGGGGIVGGQDRSGLVNCIRPVDESYRDAVYRAVGGAVGQGYLSAACDVGLGRRDIGHTALNCVAVVSEGKASLRGVISVTDGNGSDYIASRVIHDPPLWGGFISGIRIFGKYLRSPQLPSQSADRRFPPGYRKRLRSGRVGAGRSHRSSAQSLGHPRS